jgi:hypothetical protein
MLSLAGSINFIDIDVPSRALPEMSALHGSCT